MFLWVSSKRALEWDGENLKRFECIEIDLDATQTGCKFIYRCHFPVNVSCVGTLVTSTWVTCKLKQPLRISVLDSLHVSFECDRVHVGKELDWIILHMTIWAVTVCKFISLLWCVCVRHSEVSTSIACNWANYCNFCIIFLLFLLATTNSYKFIFRLPLLSFVCLRSDHFNHI